MTLIARKDPWQEQLWNVSLLPAATLPPAGTPARPDSAPREQRHRPAEQGGGIDGLGQVLLMARGAHQPHVGMSQATPCFLSQARRR
jgi:hypothetical protein